MHRKIILVLAMTAMMLMLVSGQALAVPMQRTVTVVDDQDKIIYKENILYNNTYKQIEAKITENNVSATTSTVTQPRTSTPLASRSGGANVRMVIKNACDLLGRPYTYGGGGPRSFDCSGFTRYVYRSVGINLPHNAQDQFSRGVKVSRSNLAVGDLVFFGFYGSVGIRHVGIYLGDGQFIHSSIDHGVIKTPLQSPYYVSNYKGAVRLLR